MMRMRVLSSITAERQEVVQFLELQIAQLHQRSVLLSFQVTGSDLIELLHHPCLLLCHTYPVSSVSHVVSMPATVLLCFRHLLDCN